MKGKKVERLLLKNSLAVVIPTMVLFAVLLFMFIRFPVLNQIKCTKIGNVEDVNKKMEELYKEGNTNVKYNASDLYYMGFDFYENGKRKGAYYYTVKNDNLIVVLVKTKNPENVIENYTVKGKIIKDIPTVEHIVNQLGNDNGISYEDLEGFASEYMISELDYPYTYIVMLYIFTASPFVICIIIIIYTLYVFLHPDKHPQSRQLKAYGTPRYILEEINIQLRRSLIYRKSNVYITKDYLIVSYLTKTDIIKLDCIEYMSKNETTKEGLFNLKNSVSRITLAKPEELFFEIDFSSEELADEVYEYLELLKISRGNQK